MHKTYDTDEFESASIHKSLEFDDFKYIWGSWFSTTWPTSVSLIEQCIQPFCQGFISYTFLAFRDDYTLSNSTSQWHNLEHCFAQKVNKMKETRHANQRGGNCFNSSGQAQIGSSVLERHRVLQVDLGRESLGLSWAKNLDPRAKQEILDLVWGILRDFPRLGISEVSTLRIVLSRLFQVHLIRLRFPHFESRIDLEILLHLGEGETMLSTIVLSS